ncbi:MAG: ROK family protein, partial [Alphaproteobacteria bacterium]|nr:ROK family protein [Alphaproteobacteria bacterium]
MILSFDIGGTKIAGAIFDNSEEKARVIEPMPQTGYSDFLAALDRIIEKLTAKYPNIIKFGAGFCGAYDVKRDLITSAGNVPYCVGHNLKKDIEELLEKRNIDC